jgi:hypothetical protein
MPATAIERVTRYATGGVTKIIMIPAVVATTNIPTRVEINAGTDITCEIAAYTGFTPSPSYIETPDMCSQIAGKIVGRLSMDDSTIDFYADREGVDVRDDITDGDEKWLAFMWGGDVEDTKMDVYRVTFAAHTVVGDVAGQNAVIVRYFISIVGAPAQDAAVPAAA